MAGEADQTALQGKPELGTVQPYALEAAPFRTPSGSDVLATGASARRRPVLLVCGDLANIGDLALVAQNVWHESAAGAQVFVRCWGMPPRGIAAQVESWGGRLVDGRNLMAFLSLARRCDVVLGGGELVRQNNGLRSLLSLLAGVAASRSGKGSISARGLGVGKVSGLRRAIWRAILGQARTVAVRDRRSLANVRALSPVVEPTLAADMAFLDTGLADLAGSRKSPFPGAIVVAPCIDRSEERTIDLALLCEVLASARARLPGTALVFASHDDRPGLDGDASRQLVADAGLDAQVWNAGQDLASLQALYREAALVVTNRLHAGIFTLLHRRPLLVINDGNPKLALLSSTFGTPLVGEGQQVAPEQAVEQAFAFDRGQREAALAEAQVAARRNVAGHRVAIFNVKYSPNLGDGIIAECLEGELRRADPRLDPVSLDLAGRRTFARSHGRHRKSLLTIVESLPASLRRKAVPAALKALVRSRYVPHWRRALGGADSVVIGGGALFADADQNFPIKLESALALANAAKLPVAIASVGVSDHWSAPGLERVLEGLRGARLVSVTVRDADSVSRWERMFTGRGLPSTGLAPDPGLLAARHYGPVARPVGAARRVGLCITGPLALRLHTTGRHDDQHLHAWFRKVAEGLAARGCEAVLFTNGSQEDRDFRQSVASLLDGKPGISLAPDFTEPAELARFIAGLDGVMAHRLHACIVAYSYRIPAVGLAWDAKLRSFFELTRRSQFVVDQAEMSPMHAAELVIAAMEAGTDERLHADLMEQARISIHELAACLSGVHAPAEAAR